LEAVQIAASLDPTVTFTETYSVLAFSFQSQQISSSSSTSGATSSSQPDLPEC
jgi:hypothetical protein